MGCLKVVNKQYKGKFIKMSNIVNNKKNNVKELENASNYIIPKWAINIVVTVVIACAGYALYVAEKLSDQMYELNGAVNGNTAYISELQNEMREVRDDVEELQISLASLTSRVDGMTNSLAIDISDEFYALIDDVFIENNDISNVTESVSAGVYVGIDVNETKYYAEDLFGKTVLLTYKDEGKDVFFLGQYNESYHWDGFCITNAYNLDGTLYGICESNFEDGKRIDYKTLMQSGKDKNTWWYFNRKCSGSVNEGISIRYSLEYDKVKNFTNTNVRYADILYVDDFIASQDIEMTKYYYGNTSNGKYNDDTGNAYSVEYSNGYVKTLYCGNFVDSKFEDFTGNAWYITKEDDTEYMYYKGEFVNGERVHNFGSEFKNPISKEEILELVQNKEFDCLIKWE